MKVELTAEQAAAYERGEVVKVKRPAKENMKLAYHKQGSVCLVRCLDDKPQEFCLVRFAGSRDVRLARGTDTDWLSARGTLWAGYTFVDLD